MNAARTTAWSATDAHGAKYTVTVELPEGHPLEHDGTSTVGLVDLVAIAGSDFQGYITDRAEEQIFDAEVVGHWECEAVTRMGTPETPPEYCDTEVFTYGANCPRHGGEFPC